MTTREELENLVIDDEVLVVREVKVESGAANVIFLGTWSEFRKLDLYLKIDDSILSTLLADQVVRIKNFQSAGIELIIELVRPRFRLLVLGAGHVGQAVAMIGALMGYDVVVVDDRDDFVSRSRLPDCRIKLCVSAFDIGIPKLISNENVGVVIVTRGHQSDEQCLETIVRMGVPVRYIGMIGSKRRVMSVKEKLVSRGIERDKLDQIHAPIGLDLGAVTPQEIAIAIIAEIIGVLRNRG